MRPGAHLVAQPAVALYPVLCLSVLSAPGRDACSCHALYRFIVRALRLPCVLPLCFVFIRFSSHFLSDIHIDTQTHTARRLTRPAGRAARGAPPPSCSLSLSCGARSPESSGSLCYVLVYKLVSRGLCTPCVELRVMYSTTLVYE